MGERATRLAMGTGSELARDLIEQGLDILAFDAVGAHQSARPGIREDFTERGFVLLPIHLLHPCRLA